MYIPHIYTYLCTDKWGFYLWTVLGGKIVRGKCVLGVWGFQENCSVPLLKHIYSSVYWQTRTFSMSFFYIAIGKKMEGGAWVFGGEADPDLHSRLNHEGMHTCTHAQVRLRILTVSLPHPMQGVAHVCAMAHASVMCPLSLTCPTLEMSVSVRQTLTGVPTQWTSHRCACVHACVCVCVCVVCMCVCAYMPVCRPT